MSKRDDGQWATNIAFHRSPLYPKPEKAGADTARVKEGLKSETVAKSNMKKHQVRVFLIFEFSRNTRLYSDFWPQATRHSRYEIKDSSRNEAYSFDSPSVRGHKQIADSDIVIVVARSKQGKRELLSEREMSMARRGESSQAELCRRHNLSEDQLSKWKHRFR